MSSLVIPQEYTESQECETDSHSVACEKKEKKVAQTVLLILRVKKQNNVAIVYLLFLAFSSLFD